MKQVSQVITLRQAMAKRGLSSNSIQNPHALTLDNKVEDTEAGCSMMTNEEGRLFVCAGGGYVLYEWQAIGDNGSYTYPLNSAYAIIVKGETLELNVLI